MPRTMSAAEYQELGKRYYKQKEYQKAVDAFTEAIESMTIPTTGMLNNRAASYEKLENYNAACKDGRHMIKLDKSDAKGYLRTGHTLQTMGKLDTAVKIYKYGLENVSVADESFKLLQGMLDKLIRQLSPPKSVDPFAVLPVELVEMIISYLAFRNMVTCIRVSKQWKIFLINRPRLWTHLDLSHARRPVSKVFVMHAVLRSQKKLKTATIHRFEHMDSLRSLATTCKELETLDFISGTFGGESIQELTMCSNSLRRLILRDAPRLTLDAISQVLRHAPNLELAEFNNTLIRPFGVDWKVDLPNLTTLSIVFGPPVMSGTYNMNLADLIARAPNLKHLTIGSHIGMIHHANAPFHLLESLETLKLNRVSLDDFPLLPQSLRLLHYFGGPPWDATNPTLAVAAHTTVWNLLNSDVPHLESLEFRSCGALHPEVLGLLLLRKGEGEGDDDAVDLASASTLTHLSFAGSGDGPPQGDIWLRHQLSNPRLTTLKSLDLIDCAVDDDMVDFICKTFPALERVNLGKTRISGVAIKTLCQQLSGLKWIGADFCERITSQDAILWARGKGVEVSWRMVTTAKGGKKAGWRERYL